MGYRGPTAPDGAPWNDVDVSTIADAVPRQDPITRAGNKNPYTVNGKTYHLLPTAKGYREAGMASWYGTKFHGNHTANGETYSMYGMTAAHKTLPIPAYAEVRNLANNRSVIVRINDRGPFHGDRIIDLSYAAAKKLGYAGQGTARVEVTAIDPHNFQKNSVQAPRIPAITEPFPAAAASQNSQRNSEISGFLQIGAYSSYQSAAQHRLQVSGLTTYPVVIEQAVHPVENTSLFKVIVGPIADVIKLQQLRDDLQQKGRSEIFVVYNSARPAL
ncbi:MAG: septal ring lytic transglycosylase RlpA family protein [Porticoccaceae bacterium]|nr:septal ring lytic transglycosylase RlpA family protein [Porticoccaceae bacterium]